MDLKLFCLGYVIRGPIGKFKRGHIGITDARYKFVLYRS